MKPDPSREIKLFNSYGAGSMHVVLSPNMACIAVALIYIRPKPLAVLTTRTV